jgi:hypothetical protein
VLKQGTRNSTRRNVKVKVKIKEKYNLEQAMKVQGEIEVSLYSFFNLDNRSGGW